MTEEKNWKDTLPDDVKTSSLLTGIDTVDKFWKRILDQHSYAGQSIRIPSEDASAEAKAEFRNKLKTKIPSLLEVPTDDDDNAYNLALSKLGKPEKAEEYALPAVDGFTFDDNQSAHLREIASVAGMTRRQFKNLAKKFAENVQKQAGEVTELRNKDSEAIKKEWGMTAEERYSKVIEFAKKTNAPEHLVKALESKTARASDLLWIHSLMGAGKETSTAAGDGGGNNNNGTAKLTPYEANQQIHEIQSNRNHPYHKGDKLAQKRFMELVAMANAS